MSEKICFEIKTYPAGTGSAVWDNPFTDELVHRFVPRDRRQGPMVGVLSLGELRPSTRVLHDTVVTVGEDVKAGRYGDFTLFVSSEDEDTRNIIEDVVLSRNFALFMCSSISDFENALPVGALTKMDNETLDCVNEMGGTATIVDFADSAGIEKTAAGNRLCSLHRKGFLQRIAQPRPAGDVFVDPRTVIREEQQSD